MPRFGQTPQSEHNVPQGIVNGFLIELPVPDPPDVYSLTLKIPIKSVDEYTNYEIVDASGNPTDHIVITGVQHKEAGIELSIDITENTIDGDDYGLAVYRRANEKMVMNIFQALSFTSPNDPFYSTGIPEIETTKYITFVQNNGISKKGSEGNPFNSLSELKSFNPSDGRYYFSFGVGKFQASIKKRAGIYWMLWLQYHHAATTNPSLNVISPNQDLPILDNSGLGTDNSADLTKWGHGAQSFAALIPDSKLNLLFEGSSSFHSRIIDFHTPITGRFQDDAGSWDGIQNNFYPFSAHTANLPGSVDTVDSFMNTGDGVLTSMPFFDGLGGFYWDIQAGNDWWEVDDFADGPDYDTIHKVWVGVQHDGRTFNAGEIPTGIINDWNPFPNNSPIEEWDILQFATIGGNSIIRGLIAPFKDNLYHKITLENISTSNRATFNNNNVSSLDPNRLLIRGNNVRTESQESIDFHYDQRVKKWRLITNSN